MMSRQRGRTARRVPALAMLLAIAACGGTPAGERHAETPIAWRIDAGRVGVIELGEPMPPELLALDLEAHYVARYIADAQPLDGFRFDDPPLTIALASGPFEEEIAREREAVAPSLPRLRAAGAAAARAGVAVKLVLVHGPGPATESGLGVGATLEELRAAYPDLRLRPLPETLGNDTCMANSDALSGVSFVFPSCRHAEKGSPVVRVDVWAPGT